MELKLIYNDNILLAPTAAFIRGATPYDWLKEIANWDTPLDEILCYLAPQSIKNVCPSGLFVIFKEKSFPKLNPPLDSYGEITKGVYIPVRGSLTPATTGEELQEILLWDVQVFLPGIGLIGFAHKDQIDLVDLLDPGVPGNLDWSFAHPGLPPKPAFAHINVLNPSVEEIMQNVKNGIDTKPLVDIPKDLNQKSGWLYKIWDRIKWILLIILLFIGRFFSKILPKFETSASRGSTGKNKSSFFDKLEQWINQNLEELQKKRDSELKRLLQLFEENTDEALQYAIPLDSPYLNRGKSNPSQTLSRRPFSLNLGKLGGGEAADIWDVSNHYVDLRAKYTRAAQKELEKGEFKKAAYIYAHLLGDYYSAANTLKQGQYYREAAALYKDHLKNITAAAECLEKGGLFLEAIELYKELQQHEKIGDLFDQISRKPDAELYYEKTIEIKLQNEDYIDAGRVIKDKLKNADRAKQTFLAGWQNERQSEKCLKNYFDLVRDTQTESIEIYVREVYQSYTPKHKKKKFLEVLKHVSNRKEVEGEQAYYQQLAYEITSEQAAEGDIFSLNELSHFFADDKLISSDCSRYIHTKRNKLELKRNTNAFHLDASIKWKKAAWHRNQFLVCGVKNGILHMARCNWDQNIEYYTWTNPVKPNTRFNFISSPFYYSHIILHSSDGLPVTHKNLLKNKYFPDALITTCPIWLHKRNAQVDINERTEISLIESSNNTVRLHYYSLQGDLKKSVHCYLENGASFPTLPHSSLLRNREGFYYTYSDKDFFIIHESGRATDFHFRSIIRTFAISQPYTPLWLVVSTNQGCLLCKPSDGKLNPSEEVFATDITPTSITFISTNLFVLTDKKRTILFQIQNDVPIKVQEYESQAVIISAMPSSHRGEFVIIEETGRITFCATNL